MRRNGASGQTMVHVAAMLVALVVGVGLVIDFGLALAERRQMQNAADAGALAGAREICFGNRDLAVGAAESYATANDAPQPITVEIRDGAGNIDPVNGHIVHVETAADVDTFLLSLLSIDSFTASASASAACGVAGGGCGMWPIAFPEWVWQDSCGKHIFVWDDDKISIDCETWLCDVNADGVGDTVLTGGDRGWLDMSTSFDPSYPGVCSEGGGAALIKELIADDCAGLVSLPACIPGEPGVIAAVEVPVIDRVGDTVLIPLFDAIGEEGCTGFTIVDVGCALVVAYHKNLTVDMQNPDTGEWVSVKGKVIEIMVSCGHCGTSCGSTDGTEPGGAGDMVAVSLLD